jgi:hypothetical protein
VSLLLNRAALDARRRTIDGAGELRALRERLGTDLAPFLDRPVHVPAEKALLSRWGSHCRDDGAELAFDPFAPEAQRCSRCGRVWSTDQSRRWWVYWYQLWLAERVLIAAHLAALGGPEHAGPRAVEALDALALAYPRYPNRDNVLGPSRPFFSTYLESVWVLQLAAAASLLDDVGLLPTALRARLAEEVFGPSLALIEDFPETANRQVWHAVARYAVAGVLGDEARRADAARGPHGILATLDAGLRADGLWFEGENYHWFALRGLAWGAELLREAGETDLWTDPGALGAKFRAAFRAPVLTALPDFTFPARRDSKYGVSLRQRRMAELWELAWARLAAPETAALLRFVYDPAVPAADDGVRTITEVERNEPAAGLRREGLGWKGLVWAVPEFPAGDADAWRPGSVHLEATGLAVLRRAEGGLYVSLDYGDGGGAHGHPDRLNLTVHAAGVPWLVDFGTGSYVSETLGWYRSTFAHNAPALDGSSQLPADGLCVAYEDGGAFGWACAQLPDGTAFHGAALQRTVVVAPGYVLDIVQMVSSTGDRTLMLPWHGLGEAAAHEGGVSFTRPEGELRLVLSARQPFRIELHRAPGPPGSDQDVLEFPMAVSEGEQVTLAACLDLGAGVDELECVEGTYLVRLADGGLHVHQPADEGWSVDVGHGDPVVLGGLRELPEEPPVAPPEQPVPVLRVPRVDEPPALDGTLAGFDTGSALVLDREDQYRRAEEPWPGPDRFAARAYLNAGDSTLYVGVEVVTPEPTFRPADAGDPELENENPDIHSDGLQLYLDIAGFYGWLVVPDTETPGALRVAPARGTDAEASMVTAGRWAPTGTGYAVTLAIELPVEATRFGFDVYVNRAAPEHERRVGQLVWSGGRGTRVYLAGDRALPGALPLVEVSR